MSIIQEMLAVGGMVELTVIRLKLKYRLAQIKVIILLAFYVNNARSVS